MCEKPHYLGGLVAESRLLERARKQPSSNHPLFKAALEGDVKHLRKNYRDVYLAAFEGDSLAAYHAYTRKYMTKNKHPRFNRAYRELFFSPMLQLVRFLEAHQFTVYVVSTSNQEFIRSFSEELLGLPPEQVIGSAVTFGFEDDRGPDNLLGWKA